MPSTLNVEPLLAALLHTMSFLELSDDDTVDPDWAIEAMEQAAHYLQQFVSHAIANVIIRPLSRHSCNAARIADRRNLVATWQAVVDQHGSLVWRLAYRLLGNEHDAADCYQTVFVEAFNASKRQRIKNWPGFLTRLVTTRGIDLLRSRYRHHAHDANVKVREASTPVAADPQEIAQRRELIDRLRAGLTRLPTEHAQVFCLRYFEQLSNQEIAAQMATTTNNVGVMLHRAREALREQFADTTTID